MARSSLEEISVPEIKAEEIFENTNEKIISITESKSRIIYKEFLDKPRFEDVISNFGITTAFLIPVLTTDFKSIWFMTGDMILTSFFMISIFFLCKTIKSAVSYIKTKRKYDEDAFIIALKGERGYKEKYNLYKRGYIDGKNRHFKPPFFKR